MSSSCNYLNVGSISLLEYRLYLNSQIQVFLVFYYTISLLVLSVLINKDNANGNGALKAGVRGEKKWLPVLPVYLAVLSDS